MNRTTRALSLLFVATEIIDQTDIHNYLLSLDDSVVEPPLYIPMKINRHRCETLLLVILGQFLAFLDQRLLARGKRCALAGRWRETNDKSTITGLHQSEIRSVVGCIDAPHLLVVTKIRSRIDLSGPRAAFFHASWPVAYLIVSSFSICFIARARTVTFAHASKHLAINRNLSLFFKCLDSFASGNFKSIFIEFRFDVQRKQFITKGIIFYGRTRL